MTQDYGSVSDIEKKPAAVVSKEEKKADDDDENLTCWEIFVEEIVLLKWRVLILVCFLPFGSYWVYDLAGALGRGKTASIESLFEDHGKEYTQEMNQSLYSIYSWPNTVLAFFGGVLCDNILGLRKAMFLFTLLILAGAFITYIGVVSVNYPVMMVGRFVFGLGGESQSVAQSAYIARWFRGGRGMALAFGITISFARVGSSFNFLFSPMMAQNVNVQFSVLVGVFTCLFSMVCCFAMIALDLYGERNGLVAKEVIKKDQEGGSWFEWNDVKKLGIKFWILCAICVTIYCCIFPFIAVGKPFFQVKYDETSDTAGRYVSFYQFTCAGGSPIIGALIDKMGRFCQFIIISSALFTLCHTLFWLAAPNPIAMMMTMGVAYSFVASSLWPGVPYVVGATETGLAFGVMTSCQNTGLAILPLLSGAILDKFTPTEEEYNPSVFSGFCEQYKHSDFDGNTSGFPNGSLLNCSNNTNSPLATLDGFRDAEILFASIAALGILLGVWLTILDRRSEFPVLSCAAEDRPPSPEELLEQERKRKEKEEQGKAPLLGDDHEREIKNDDALNDNSVNVDRKSNASMNTVDPES